jgi:hypothetical protein
MRRFVLGWKKSGVDSAAFGFRIKKLKFRALKMADFKATHYREERLLDQKTASVYPGA